jgi:hypothetical protein
VKKSFFLVFFSTVAGAYADFSIQLDAGRLRIDASVPLPHVDNTSPSNGGSLLLLIAANGDGGFDNNVTSGNYVAGNDLLLAAGGFNTSGGTDETITFFYVSTNNLTLPAIDRIALRWFPEITFQDYKNGVTPSAGQTFGTYNPRTSNPPNAGDNPDGGDPWLVPLGGSIGLNFFTTGSDLGGTQDPGEAYAQFVIGTGPSPSPTATPTPPPTVNISGTVSYCSNPVPGPVLSVTLILTGSASGSTLSDGSGNYTFTSLATGGSYTVTPAKSVLAPGATGINTVDAVATQRHFLVLGTPLSGCPLTAADVNGDTSINTVDVIAVQRFFLALTTGIANVGNYQFTPAHRTYTGLTSNQTAQNYETLVFGDVASPFAERLDRPSQSTGGDGTSVSALSGLNTRADEVAAIAAVALPEVAVAQSKSDFISAGGARP